MDKNKQIEDKKQLIEILKNSKDIVSYQPNAREIPFWGSDKRKFFIQDDNGHLTIHFDKIVDEIYKQGYQKVDNGSVVLTKEEYEILTDISTLKNKVQEALNINAIGELIQVEREARKQAIEEFAERLKELWQDEDASCCTQLYDIDELAKEMGVEL